MFWNNLREYKPAPTQLSDWLPWLLQRSPSVIELKQTGLMRVLRYRGRDSQSMGTFELGHMANQFNRAAKRLGEGFSLQIETVCRYSEPPQRITCGIPAVDAVEYARTSNLASSAVLKTIRYITITYTPKVKVDTASGIQKFARLFGGLFEGEQVQTATGGIDVEKFSRETQVFADMLRETFVEANWLEDDELLTFLHSCCSDNPHHINSPDIPMYIDGIVGSSSVDVGTKMRLGANYMHIVSVKGYPQWSNPKLMDRFRNLSFEYRWVNRFLGLSTAEGSRDIGRLVKDVSTPADKAEVNKLKGLNDEGHVSVGYHSVMVVVWDTDERKALANAHEVETTFNLCGFAAVLETGNTWGGWLSTQPGHVWSNPRRSVISTKNLSHMVALGSDWMGDEVSTHYGQAPLLHCISSTGGPFRLNHNVGDVGHTLVLGPTGAGKSVYLNLIQMSHLKYEHARVITFDKGRSCRAVCLACDGTFLELGRKDDTQTTTFQPLRYINNEAERAWAGEWLEDVYRVEGVPIGPDERSAIRQALNTVASAPINQRTLTYFALQLQGTALQRGLAPYIHTADGPGSEAWLWDNRSEELADARWLAFEMSALMDRGPRVTTIVLTYLFHRLEARFDGRPTMLVLDEAWVFLSDPVFSDRIKTWLKVLRKQNVYVVFATQDISDALSSPIAPTLIQNCPTKVLLPNPLAESEAVKSHYTKLGLTNTQIALICRAKPKRDYYIDNARGSRLFQLGLHPGHIDFALVTASSPKDHTIIDHVLATKPARMSFGHAYFKALGFEQYVQFFQGESHV